MSFLQLYVDEETLTNLLVTDSIEDDDVTVLSPQSATDSEPTPISKRINRMQSHSVASVLENYLKNKSDKANDDDPLEHFFLSMAKIITSSASIRIPPFAPIRSRRRSSIKKIRKTPAAENLRPCQETSESIVSSKS
ncbi:hypothetical protein CBL_20070 [Carabus blaptoides fortunei]